MADFSGRPNPWATIAKLVATLVAAGVIIAGFVLPYVGGAGLAAASQATKFANTTCNLTETPPPQATYLYAKDGKTVIAKLFSQDRVPITLTQVPKYLVEALVATEDRRFYSHHGVDLRGLLRSAVSTSGGDTQGGSTLTMQYVKQEFLFQAGDNVAKQNAATATTISRKMLDAKCALYIEGTRKESKDQILENYLNIAAFNENAFGIETAAETYFNKHASQLTLDESAMLVGMLRAPDDYDPFKHRAASQERRNEVLQNLVDVGKLSEVEAKRLAAEPIALATNAPPQVKQGCANANPQVPNAAFFCEYTVNYLESVSGLTDTQLNTGGLKIITTLDPQIQASTQQQIQKAVPATSPVTAVLPSVDPRTGDVLAMAASKTFGSARGQTEQPIFTKYVAQGASTYKLFPLLAALQIGVPSQWPLYTPTPNYKPHNCPAYGKGAANGDANEQYNPTETLASATAKSSNTFYVGLADQLLDCNLQPILDIARKLGMKGLDQKDGTSKLTIAQNVANLQQAQRFVLGSVETSPLELTGAYAAIANHGSFNAPAPVISITDNAGRSLPTKRVASVQAVSPQAADAAVKILEGDTLTQDSGTSAGVFSTYWYSKDTSRIAGKTGTAQAVPTSKNGAIWFVGMTPKLVATSALINFDNPSAPSAGLPGEKAGKAYGDYASKVWIKSLEPSLVGQKWKWPSAGSVAGDAVPPIEGMQLPEATSTLKDAGFKIQELDPSGQTQCADKDNLNAGTVAYSGPSQAPKGSTIIVCLASGVAQDHYIAPKIVKKKPKPGTSSSATRRPGRATPARGRGITRPPR